MLFEYALNNFYIFAEMQSEARLFPEAGNHPGRFVKSILQLIFRRYLHPP
jgi:hypothetical protein